jgi:hypothetical protein
MVRCEVKVIADQLLLVDLDVIEERAKAADRIGLRSAASFERARPAQKLRERIVTMAAVSPSRSW